MASGVQEPGQKQNFEKTQRVPNTRFELRFSVIITFAMFFMEIMGNFVRLFSSLDVSDFSVQIGGMLPIFFEEI